jgi:hypothetical protein
MIPKFKSSSDKNYPPMPKDEVPRSTNPWRVTVVNKKLTWVRYKSPWFEKLPEAVVQLVDNSWEAYIYFYDINTRVYWGEFTELSDAMRSINTSLETWRVFG